VSVMKNFARTLAAAVMFGSPWASLLAQTGASSEAASLTIGGAVERPLQLQLADLEKMPRVRVAVKDHDGSAATYEGVLVADVLNSAGAVTGEKMRGGNMATYLLAEAKDGYRVIFALAEVDPGFTDSQVIVAFARNGKPLAEGQGPLRIIAPQDKRPARWIRMVKKLEVVKIP
jgi:DMSO/TMAO reductase YedYZ molybdopterin-dependent catalytic subunit